MVKEALGKVESARVTSSGFDFMRHRRAEGESILFRSRARIKGVISGVSLGELRVSVNL